MSNKQVEYKPRVTEQETTKFDLSVKKVTSLEGLISEARGDVSGSERVMSNLKNLFERAGDSGKGLFLVESGGTTFTVLADNEQVLRDHQEEIYQLIKFQGSVDANSLWGNCIYIHQFAAAMGFTDGNASASREVNADDDKSIYPIRGLHDVGWKKVGDKVIWVDFTSRPYVFSNLGDAEKSAFDGIIVVQDSDMSIVDKLRGKKSAMQVLYQCKWRLDNFNPNDSLLDYVMMMGREKFVKRNN